MRRKCHAILRTPYLRPKDMRLIRMREANSCCNKYFAGGRTAVTSDRSGMLRRMSAGSFAQVGEHFRRLTRPQRHAFLASFLSWSLDALDFFLLIMCIPAIASEFHTPVSSVADAVFLTLVFRPVGAFLFGALADRIGRKRTLILNILCYSAIELS